MARLFKISFLVGLSAILGIGLIFTQTDKKAEVRDTGTKITPTQNYPKVSEIVSSPSSKPIKVIKNTADVFWFYPNAQELESDQNELKLSSSDNPQVITDWYKNNIIFQGYSSKSFINTTSNGNTINQLVGSDGKREVDIEIKKQNNSSVTFITISVDPAS